MSWKRNYKSYSGSGSWKKKSRPSLRTNLRLFRVDQPDIYAEEVDFQLLASLKVPIVGIKHYNGVVHSGEWLHMSRERDNQYDANAIRVDNSGRKKVGHFGRDFAKAFAPFFDSHSLTTNVRMELTVDKRPAYGAWKAEGTLQIYGNPGMGELLQATIEKNLQAVQILDNIERNCLSRIQQQQQRNQEMHSNQGYKNMVWTPDTTVGTPAGRSSYQTPGSIPKLDPAPNCRCQPPERAIERTVSKEGPNTGRQFFACCKPRGSSLNCKFFQWKSQFLDERRKELEELTTLALAMDNANGTTSSSQIIVEPEPEPEKPKCNCYLEANEYTTRKEGRNKGRKFFVCPKPRHDKRRCKFFQWKSDWDEELAKKERKRKRAEAKERRAKLEMEKQLSREKRKRALELLDPSSAGRTLSVRVRSFDAESAKKELESMFDKLGASHQTLQVPDDLSSVLSSKLFPHQEQGVAWMLLREGFTGINNGTVSAATTTTSPLTDTDTSNDATITPSTTLTLSTKSKKTLGVSPKSTTLRDSPSNSPLLPPFWESKVENGVSGYFNSLTNSFTSTRPHPIRGGFLCDDMGVGKTIQMCTLIAYSYSKHPRQANEAGVLIICPMSVMSNWQTQLKEHIEETCSLSVYIYHGISRCPDVLFNYDVVITTYGMVTTDFNRSPWLQTKNEAHGGNLTDPNAMSRSLMAFSSTYQNSQNSQNNQNSQISQKTVSGSINTSAKPNVYNDSQGLFAKEKIWRRIILDECHTIRNRNTRSFKSCDALQAKNRWGLTGTPVINGGDDLQSLFSFLKVDPLTDVTTWKRAIGRGLKTGDELSFARLRCLTKSLCMRRTKAIIQDKLPNRSIDIVSISLDGCQKEAYDLIFSGAKFVFDAALNSEVGSSVVLSQYSKVLEVLTRLRQICCSHELVNEERMQAARELKDYIEIFKKERATKNAKGEVVQVRLSKKEVDVLFAKLTAAVMGSSLLPNSGSNLNGESPSSISNIDNNNINLCPEECCICFETLDEKTSSILMKCQHVFCNTCLRKISDQSGKCPLCRAPYSKSDMMSVEKLRQLQDTQKEKENEDPNTNLSNENAVKKTDVAGKETGCIPKEKSDNNNDDFVPVKIVRLLQDAKTIREKKEKVLIFSNFTSFLDLVRNHFSKSGIGCVSITGKQTPRQRSDAIKAFKNDPNVTAFLISMKAGGTGLNLVTANHCYICDVWWNYSTEEQAMDRCYRIGQKKDVKVVRFCIENSIEERILELQERKRAVAKGAMRRISANELRKTKVDELRRIFD
eukprot:g4216.t1